MFNAIRTIMFAAAFHGAVSAAAGTSAEAPDIRSVEPDLHVPPISEGQPAPGKRVKQTIAQYQHTAVYHALYLPTDWRPGRHYPVIVEYAGNGPYKNKYGDVSTGKVEGSKLAYGVSGGKGFIWICMPYLNNAGSANVTRWWGDGPQYNVEPTVDYCKRAVRWVCEHYGGDPDAVILTGFSRGAIACNYVGLHDDEIARLWLAFIAFSHYDGVITTWGYRAGDRASARKRLERLGGRAQFICGESGASSRSSVSATKRYLESTGIQAPFTFRETGFRNHDDAWTLRPCSARKTLRQWLEKVLRQRPGRS